VYCKETKEKREEKTWKGKERNKNTRTRTREIDKKVAMKIPSILLGFLPFFFFSDYIFGYFCSFSCMISKSNESK
jgi:hypothetical protein